MASVLILKNIQSDSTDTLKNTQSDSTNTLKNTQSVSTDTEDDSLSDAQYDYENYQDYQDVSFESEFQKKLNFKECHLLYCEKQLEIDQENRCSQRCDCGLQLDCDSCLQEAHLPLTCEQKFQWDCLDPSYDIKTLQILQHQKNYKNGDCGSMLCTICQTNFCQACLKITKDSSHTQNCNDDSKDRLFKKFSLLKHQVQQNKKNFYENIEQIQERIEIVFKNDDDLEEEMQSFIIPSLNVLLKAKIFYLYLIPLRYFEQNNQRSTILKYEQKELKHKLSMLEKQLIEESNNLFNIQKILKNNNNQEIDLKSKYDLYRIQTQKQVKELQQSLNSLIKTEKKCSDVKLIYY